MDTIATRASTASFPHIPGDGEISIDIRNVTKRFHTRRGDVVALNDVSMRIERGEKLVLLGPSGCGKTTLLRCVAGLEYPDEGEIEVNGRIVFSSGRGIAVPPEQRGVSMVFQSYALWPHMTVFDNVAFPLTNLGVSRSGIEAQVTQALSAVGCDGLATRYPNQLSGGQQQRISLARAIVGNSDVVLFDEPLSNVDAKVREQLRIELVAMQKKFNFTALYVTHDQIEASAIAHRIAVMKMGTVEQIGTPNQIYEQPCSRYVADFVGASNEFDGSVASISNGVAEVDTELGRIAAVAPQDIAVGQKVSILIRPESLSLTGDGEGINHVPTVLESIMFLGLCTEYVLAAGGKRLVARTMHPSPLREGQKVAFEVKPEHVLIFK